MADPLDPKYEKAPDHPLPDGFVPFAGVPVRVEDGDDWGSLSAAYARADPWDLITYNFQARDPREVNHYLRTHVGCTVATSDRKNWRFTSSARPGVVYVPATRRMVDPRKNLHLDLWVGAGLMASASFINGVGIARLVMFNVGSLCAGSAIAVMLNLRFTSHTLASALVASVGVVITGLPVSDFRTLDGLRLTPANLTFYSRHGDVGTYIRAWKNELMELVRNQDVDPMLLFRSVSNTFRHFGVPTRSHRPKVRVLVSKVAGLDLGEFEGTGSCRILA
ncbi:MAG TPA: hypothetical protein VKU85_13805 [bacterium]|nr:hypothetical protein [bacterium]